jgi:hypothetical protein
LVFRCLVFFTDSSKCLVSFSDTWGTLFFPHMAKFSRILHEHKISSEHSHFILHLAIIHLLLWLELNTSEKIFYFHEVFEKIWLSPQSIQIKWDSSRCLVFLGQLRANVCSKISSLKLSFWLSKYQIVQNLAPFYRTKCFKNWCSSKRIIWKKLFCFFDGFA